MTTFFRIIRTGLVSFKRNIWLSSATMVVLTISLSLALGIALFGVVVDGVVAELESKVDVSVYFKPDASETDIAEIRETLEKFPEVVEVRYTSREEALANFKERHRDNEVIQAALAELQGNPLEASLAIQARDASAYSAIASFLEGRFSSAISKVNYRENAAVIERIFRVTNAVRLVGIGVGAVLFAIAGLLAFNAIRIAIFSFREEIAVMRLVGASNWFIRGPFLVAGIISGLLGAVVTFSMFFAVVWFVRDPVLRFIPGVDLLRYYRLHWAEILGFVSAVAVFVSTTSSFVAIRRYLRV
jgi:cell division transport system permease protein